MSELSVIHGDCASVLPMLAAGTFDAVVTDPPYHLTTGKKGGSGAASLNPNSPAGRARVTTGFMGKAWDGGELAHDPALWREVLRVAKPGAYLLAFGGTRTYHRLTCAIEDAGWEIRDCLMWLYGCGFPKSLNLDGGLGTALKPAWEPIILARAPLVGTVAANLAGHGTGALRIDECRIPVEDGAYEKNCSGDRGHSENKSRAMDFQMGCGRANGNGRFPANLLHDGSPEVVAMFPESDGQSGEVTGLEPSAKTNDVYGSFNGRPATQPQGDIGSAARFFFSGKATRADREEGLQAFEPGQRDESREPDAPGANNPRNRGGQERRNRHPTVKPTALMRWLCRLVTPAGGTVLDPFCGSGSTGKACAFERLGFVGIEQEAEYVAIARARIAWALSHRAPEQLALLEEAI